MAFSLHLPKRKEFSLLYKYDYLVVWLVKLRGAIDVLRHAREIYTDGVLREQ